MGLTEEQIAKRRGMLTASRVAPLMTGDKEKIMRLYREMIGEEVEEDLSNVWPVQLGSATEELNLRWYEKKNGVELAHSGHVIPSPHVNWAVATLDGYDRTLKCPVEAKHVGGREPMETIIDRYQPQMQFQMWVMESKMCALSVIMGANEPIVEYIDRDDAYIAEMVKRGEEFMLCVSLRRPPVDLEPVPPPADATKIIDMTGDDVWHRRADIWLQSYQAAQTAKESEKVLKEMMPDDAKKCFGHGVRITRDRAGRLSLRRDE